MRWRLWRMPEICRFYGIVIQMYFNDHAPVHFHARYGSDRAVVCNRSASGLAWASSSTRPKHGLGVDGAASAGAATRLDARATARVARHDSPAGMKRESCPADHCRTGFYILEPRTLRLGFMAGQIDVPDDFNCLGGPEIEQMFGATTRGLCWTPTSCCGRRASPDD